MTEKVQDRLITNLTKPTLTNLSYVLRHPDTWPKGFMWNYSHCDTCAMALAHRLWETEVPPSVPSVFNGTSNMARVFAMPYSAAKRIFFSANYWGIFPFSRRRVTPDRVANLIDKYLAVAE